MAKLSKKILLDSSVVFAFIDRGHPKHDEASAFFRYFAQEKYHIFLDIFNMNQAYTKIYTDISPSLAKDYLRVLSLSSINIIYPEESDLKTAIKTLASYTSTDLTFTQAVTSVIASRRDIPQICTFDYLHQLFGIQLFYLPL